MKEMVKYGEHSGWTCLAGQHAIFIDEKGDFSPCVSLKRQGGKKWGNLDYAKLPFDERAMKEQLSICNSKCLSCANTLTTRGEQNLLGFLKPYIITRINFLLHRY